MAEKNKKNIEEIEAEAGKRLIDFMALCKCLFGDPEPPYDINELKPESPYYDTARKLAKDCLYWCGFMEVGSIRVLRGRTTVRSLHRQASSMQPSPIVPTCLDSYHCQN